ncbi:LacI family transcriptional regulator [Kribbella pittospori]|uniref:LacI family transcriptional regulator n=1 Tax=Kribbella pittospori TaxID=722689 RepID=A0A4V2MA31_9ACTN|nr:LacI family DNA-binding transcriptional regulator [Kribbella pittospori]TCC57712.1 LacI family transcriptional regulator [Kribbella pittospori]
MAATLSDVAARAGVSIKTVSNVVNGTGRVGAETRDRVERVIEELGYRPNVSARNLRHGKSGVIALAVPQIGNPYFAELAELVVKAAEGYGWTVLIDQTDADPDRERLVLQGIRSHLIDGLLFVPGRLSAEDFAARTDTTPMVLLGERLTRVADRVAIDSYAAARAATEHLIDLGRTRIAAIGATASGDAVSRGRYEGYHDALVAAGHRPSARLVVPQRRWRHESGVEAVGRLLALSRPPDALFCSNDLLAHGALRALHDHGVRVPDDIAVVGIDDIAESRFSRPSLTSVAPDKRHIAETAVGLLADRLKGSFSSAPREFIAGFHLEVRESTEG